jgi:uncharacterized protein YukE
MADEAMPDEYYQRYSKLTHDELYRQLMAGAPPRVEAVANAWHTAGDTLGSLTTALRNELTTLTAGWAGPAAREFQYRLGLIATYAQKLVDEAASISSGLTVMSTTLRQEQQQAEPAQPGLPAAPAIVGVVGATLGHTPTPDEQAKAQERMTTLVAQLAADYAVTDHRSWPAEIPAAPADLPDTVLTGMSNLGAVPRPAGIVSPLGGVGLAGVGLAGAGGPALAAIGHVPGNGHVAPPPAAAQPTPATLAGAMPGLAGAPRSAIDARAGTETDATTSAGASNQAGQAGMPLAAAAGVVRPADGYVSDDPRLLEDGSGWARHEGMAWRNDADTPPSILGTTAPA